MQLFGMLDSPFVRRVAVSMNVLRLPFEHRPVSVHRGFDEFAQVNPVVKAPTLLTDSGVVLMDSTLILEHLESLAPPERSLMPSEPKARELVLRQLSLSLAACEKAVQIVYERTLRPAEKLHQPWLDRVERQLKAALEMLETEIHRDPEWRSAGAMNQAEITTAVTWRFIQHVAPGSYAPERFPGLAAQSAQAEAFAEFQAADWA
ncbi:glutathione S-transferase [Phenylobacterium sp.]|uniref:glutathione S-transferase n=1 Tax=Phenylobacterium sp. TaxID=1871053 RepID=UPI003BAC8018